MADPHAFRQARRVKAEVQSRISGRAGLIGTGIGKVGERFSVEVLALDPSAFADLPSQIRGVPIQVIQSGPVVPQGAPMSTRGIHPKLDAAGQALWVRVDQLNPGQVAWVGFDGGTFFVHQGGCVQTPLQFPSTWAGHPVTRRPGGIVSVAPPAWVWPRGSRCKHGVPTGSANAVCSSCGITQSKAIVFGSMGVALLGLGALGDWWSARAAGR